MNTGNLENITDGEEKEREILGNDREDNSGNRLSSVILSLL